MKRALLALVPLAAACGDPDLLPPRGQVVLYMDTDAVLPPAPGAPPETLLAPMPLFDRMLVEVFAPGEMEPCADCRRELDIDRASFQRGEASIGIVPSSTEPGHRARVRMYRAASVRGAGPPPSVSLESTVELPAVGAEGIIEVTVFLPTESVGAAIGDPAAPVQPEHGRPTGERVGSWARAARADCAQPPASGEVCIPGGAYWMGDRDLVGAAVDGDAERLVVISPFYLDATEVTVAAYRLSGLPAQAWSGNVDGTSAADVCTFTEEPGPRDALPVNCVSWDNAQAYCLWRGADLPTEAEWEYAARALLSSRYVWGLDPPACLDAVWGFGTLNQAFLTPPTCPLPGLLPLPQPPGSGLRDRLLLPTGTVVDLAANVREWTRDVFQSQYEPCWTTSLLVDPVCSVPGIGGENQRSIRGDAFFQNATLLGGAGRADGKRTSQLVSDGFRCARRAL